MAGELSEYGGERADLAGGGLQFGAAVQEGLEAGTAAARARLDLVALAKFEADWTAATARARDEYSLLPAWYFVEHWFTWVDPSHDAKLKLPLVAAVAPRRGCLVSSLGWGRQHHLCGDGGRDIRVPGREE